MKNRILFNYLGEVEESELDFVLMEQDLKMSEREIEKRGRDIIKNNNGYYGGEANPINIQKAIDLLESFKKIGATHVEIIDHCDHIGYVFNPLEVKIATDKEIAEAEGIEIIEDELAKEKARERLRNELEKLG